MESKKFKTVDEYHKTFPKEVREKLEEMRATIRSAAPEAEEVISYNMPGYKLHGSLVFYAANKNHIGFYPLPSAIKEFKEELAVYKTSKGAIQFPLEKKLPKTLVKNIVKFRVAENKEIAAVKVAKKRAK